MAEVVGEFDGITEFIAEFEIRRNIGIQMLLDTYKFESRRALIDWRTHDAARHRTTRNFSP